MKARYAASCLQIHSLPFLTYVLQSYFLCIYQTHVSPNGLGLASENHQQGMAARKGEKMGNSLSHFSSCSSNVCLLPLDRVSACVPLATHMPLLG